MRHDFAFYIVVAIALVALASFAPAIPTAPTAQTTQGAWQVTLDIPEPAPPAEAGGSEAPAAPSKPGCSPGCGELCWLVSSGSPPGTHGASGGTLGLLDCAGLCWDVSEYEENCG